MTKIVVNGTFDILHLGHIGLLNYAKSLGSYLMVLIDSDRRVKELKGNERPVHNQDFRKTMLENLKAVDFVHIFDSDYELECMLDVYRPDIMVKGSDYVDKPIIGAKYCRSIVYYKRTDESTTQTIQNIINRR